MTNSLRNGLRRRSELLAAALRPPGRGPAPLLGVAKASRLVESPVFVLSSVRSGSTLLRVLLNSHPAIHAPHELHLRTLAVEFTREFTEEVMAHLGLGKEELEHLLWDRVLHLELERSGKELVVDKTPANALCWKRLQRAWPRARYIFLLRHPGAIVTSVMNRRSEPDLDEVVAEVLGYAEGIESARRAMPGLTVRYEELTTEPEAQTRRLCSFLRVRWEPGMLDYGSRDHGPYRPYFGDWSSELKSGRIHPARLSPTGQELPEKLRDTAVAWGYPT